MSRWSVICAVLTFLSVAYAVDICKSSSVAQRVVDALSPTAFNGITTRDGVTAAFQALQTAGAATGQTGGVLVGLASGELYGLLGCRICSGGVTQQFVVINAAAYGGTALNVYSTFNATGAADDSISYNHLVQSWYTGTPTASFGLDGWSVNPLDALWDWQPGFAYVYRKPFTTPAAGVVAGFRFASEPCGTCYVSTFPPTLVVNQAASVAPTAETLQVVGDFQRFIDFLLPYVKNNTNAGGAFASVGYINFIVGFATGESFMIKDCGLLEGGGSAQCANPATRYQLWVTSSYVFGVGNNTRIVYNINADGSLGSVVGVAVSPASPTGTYDVTTRGFFLARNGWSNFNTVVDVSQVLPRRFVLASGNGHNSNGNSDGVEAVIGGEFVDGGDGVCSSSPVVAVASLWSVLLVFVVALFRM